VGKKIENILTSFRFPWVTLLLIGLNLAVFLWQRGGENLGLAYYLHEDYSFEWNRFLKAPFDQFPTLFSNTFFHSDWFHYGGNMVFFLLFGPALELTVGALPFFLIYFLSGAAATLTQAFFSPLGSLVGSSGAISGAAGAVFVLYPLKMPEGLFRRHFPWISRIPVSLYIGAWFLWNLRMGFKSLFPSYLNLSAPGGIAYWAHVGGFAAGALLILPFLFLRHEPSN